MIDEAPLCSCCEWRPGVLSAASQSQDCFWSLPVPNNIGSKVSAEPLSQSEVTLGSHDDHHRQQNGTDEQEGDGSETPIPGV